MSYKDPVTKLSTSSKPFMTTPLPPPRKAPRCMHIEQLLWSFTSDAGRELWQKVVDIAEVDIGTVDSCLRRTRRRRGSDAAENW